MDESNTRLVSPYNSGKHGPGFPIALSLLLAVMMSAASILGLLHPGEVYPSQDLRLSFLANDVVNLVVGLPTLLLAVWLSRRGKLVGLLLMPGSLMYVLYNYLAYIFSVPMNWYYLLLLALVTISAYTLIGSMACLDINAISQQLGGSVPARLSAGLMFVFGVFVFLRVFLIIARAQTDPASVAASDLAVLPADFLIAPAWIIGAVLLWGRKPLGHVAGLGLLFQANMLFVGLIALMLLQPLVTGAPTDITGVITVAIMGLVCLIPFGLYLRGVARASRIVKP